MSDKPRVQIVGTDGNAFALLGRCRVVARAARWSEAEIDAFTREATSGNYDHLLATIMDRFEVS